MLKRNNTYNYVVLKPSYQIQIHSAGEYICAGSDVHAVRIFLRGGGMKCVTLDIK